MQRASKRWLLPSILGAIGCGSLTVGCGGEASTRDDDESVSEGNSNAAGGGALMPGVGTSPSAAASSSEGADEEGAEPDELVTDPPTDPPYPTVAIDENIEELGSRPFTPCDGLPREERSQDFFENPFGVAPADVARLCGGAIPMESIHMGVCLPAPPKGESCEQAYTSEWVAGTYECGYQNIASFVCGPIPVEPMNDRCIGGECCYVMSGGCPIGRPFIVADAARQAELASRKDWLAPASPDVSRLDAATRRALADAYGKDALAEHASVAAFARFVLECLALGAPVHIVSEAQRALADEIEHARLSFALASAYGGQELGPTPLDVRGALGSVELEDSVRRTIREGCIAETVAAALVHAAASAAKDAFVASALAKVAEDERRHAVLAWRFVRWALEQGDAALFSVVAEEFQSARERVGFGAVTDFDGDARALHAHGYLSVEERHRVALETLEHVVLPCASTLQAPPAAQSRARAPHGDALPA